MLLCKTQLTGRPLCCGAPTRSRAAVAPSAQSFSRRDLLASLASVALLVASPQDATAADSLSALNSTSGTNSGFISIAPINKAAKEILDRRDDAMEYKCKGGMFDCDGDRRDFAHKQYQEWLDAGGVPKRIREGRPEGPRSF